jgi:hypothetical protein
MWNSWSTVSSPWKMLPPINPSSCSMSYGPITCRSITAEREFRVQVDRAVGVGLELLSMRLRAPLVRNPLAEHREHVDAVGRQTAIDGGRDRPVHEGSHGATMLEVGVLERSLRILSRPAQLDGTGVVILQLGARVGDEVRQLAHGDVDLHDA